MKVKKRELSFYLSYFMLYIALFMRDIYAIYGLDSFTKIIRILSYIFIILAVFDYKLKLKGWIIFVLMFGISLSYGIYTSDLYWSILVFLIYGSKNIDINTLFAISFKILLVGAIIVVFFCLIGFLPDVLTIRDTTIADSVKRHSFGFYHSNVLPLIVLYLEVYYVILEKEHFKILIILVFGIVSGLLNIFCNSRNAFGLSLILTLMVIIEKRVGFSSRIRHIFYMISKYSVVLISFFSVAMTFLLLRGGIWDYIDAFFSGRFRLAIFKMRRTGLHLINLMSNEEFVSDNIQYVNGKMLDTIIIDNGYLYVILRYGILIILFYIIVSVLLARKAKDNIYLLLTLIIVFTANFIDNDFVDYSFLPFILFAFNDCRIINRQNSLSVKKIRLKLGE